MARTIHELAGIITADVGKFVAGIGVVIQHTQKLAQAWSKAGASINAAANRIGVAAGAMTGVVVRQFAKFEDTMVRVGAVTQTIGTDAFQQLEDAARHAGATTRFTAQQSAEAMEKLGLAGLKVNEIIAALPGSLQLATAAQLDIATAADVAAKTMRAFGFQANQLTRINDTMVAAFTKSNTDLRQLAEAMKHVGPVSNVLNVSLEETTAVLAKLADAGFQGSIGGTSLRNILSRLAGAVPEVQTKLKALGINTLDAAGNMRPLFQILREIEAAGLSGGQIMELFGQRGGPQMAALLDIGVDSLEAFKAELDGAAGIAAKLEAESKKTLTGRFMLLISAVQDLVLSLGKSMSPALKEAIGNLEQFINENRVQLVQQMVNWFGRLGDFVKSATGRFREIAPAIFQTSKIFSDWFGTILRFLAEHPRILAALMVFKAGHTLGINRALFDTAAAVTVTGKAAGALAVKALALAAAFFGVSKAALALKLALGGLVIGAGVLAGVFLSKLLPSVREYTKATEQAIKRTEEFAKRTQQGYDKVLAKVDELQGAQKRKFLNEQLQMAEKNLEGINWQVENERKNVEALSTTWNKTTGNKLLEDARRELEATEQRLAAHQQFVEELRERQRTMNVTAEMELPPPATQEAAEGFGLAMEDMAPQIGDAIGENAAEKIEDLMRDAQNRALDRQQKGAGGIRSLLDTEGLTGEDLARWIGLQEGGTEAIGESAGMEFAALGPGADSAELDALALQIAQKLNDNLARASNAEAATPVMKEFGAALRQVQADGTMSRAELDRMAQAAMTMRQQLANGEITLEQFRTGMDRLQHSLENVTADREKFRDSLKEMLVAGQLTSKQRDEFSAQFDQLANDFTNGRITVQTYQRRLADLNSTVQDAANATERENAARQRAALLRGDFRGAGLSMQAALEERMAQFRMQQFNAQVDAAFNGLMGFNQGLQNATGQFQNLGSQVHEFGVTLSGSASGFAAGVGEAFAGVAGLFQSSQGQLALIANQISMLQQTLQLQGLSADRRRQLLEQIASLEQQYLDILNAPPPVSLTSAEELFRDPGLQMANEGSEGSSSGGGRGGVTVHQHFRSLRTPDAQDMRTLVDAVNTELQRKGHNRLF